MRITRSLAAAGALATAAATIMAMAPLASADPIGPNGKFFEPKAFDVALVGSESLSQVANQLTFNYNKTVSAKKHGPTNPWIFSWDAVPQFNLNDTTQKIVIKAGCKKNTRPNGSTAGITDMFAYGNTSYKFRGKTHTVPCIDAARSSRPHGSSDPAIGPGGVQFVTLAGDAVTYATAKNSNAPKNLTKAQLASIFGCTVLAANGDPANSWGALLGNSVKNPKALFDPIVPQAGSGTLSFWMKTALGLTTTTEPACGEAKNLTVPNQPEENEGTNGIFKHDTANVIFPFSIGVYVAQQFHSAQCGKAPSKTQNKFGCDQNGILFLNPIAGVSPTVKGPNKTLVTNPHFPATFHRFLFDVVRWQSKGDHIPGYLEKFLGAKGYFCKQKAVLAAYGFESTPACGH